MKTLGSKHWSMKMLNVLFGWVLPVSIVVLLPSRPVSDTFFCLQLYIPPATFIQWWTYFEKWQGLKAKKIFSFLSDYSVSNSNSACSYC